MNSCKNFGKYFEKNLVLRKMYAIFAVLLRIRATYHSKSIYPQIGAFSVRSNPRGSDVLSETAPLHHFLSS